jgi:cellulose synthase/poly-beta-1,6-N-acetylglucosamine synthase-like glycosyltransferase
MKLDLRIENIYPLATDLSLAQETLLAVAAIITGLIGIFAIDIWIVNMLFFRLRKPTASSQSMENWPRISVHLPLYNEENVASRLMEACLALDYPAGNLEIIVVDDSTDRTTEIVRTYERRYHDKIKLIHRPARIGFKGGALSEALKHTTADYIAIFDADNVPPKNFLKVMLPKLVSDPHLAFVEARRTHMDSESSWILRAMSLGLDIYAFVDQRVRSSFGLLAHFSGSGGIFRRQAIEEVGGWDYDTLAEDLDLSVRLELAGWRYLYDPTVTSLGEMPKTFESLKGQQNRWAKGYTQCFRKHFSSIIRSKRLSRLKKGEALIHLGTYLVFPLTLIGTLDAIIQYFVFPLPTLFLGLWAVPKALFVYGMSLVITTAPIASTLLTMREKGDRKYRKVFRLVYLTLILYGLLLSNTRAVIEALIGKKSTFYRTPKGSIQSQAK